MESTEEVGKDSVLMMAQVGVLAERISQIEAFISTVCAPSIGVHINYHLQLC